jgi:hypothetical protein
MSETQQQRKPWEGFGYEPVGVITNKLISRYLRTQRKNMRRFFEERGLFTLAERMNQIRKSRQGMLEKNRMFQAVLNDYSRLANTSVAGSSDIVPTGVPNLAVQPTPVIAGESEAENT